MRVLHVLYFLAGWVSDSASGTSLLPHPGHQWRFRNPAHCQFATVPKNRTLLSLSLSLQIQDHKIGIIMHTLMAYECTCCALNTASYMIRVVVDLRSCIDFVHKRSRSKVLRDTKPAAPGAMVHVRQPDSNGSEVIFCTTMQSGALQVDDFSATLSEIRNPKFLETSCLI